MISYPKIRQFKDIIREVKARVTYSGRDESGMPIYDPTAEVPILTYSGTVKLHGTNASVVLAPNNEVRVQSRKRVITVEKDNHGFAKFVDAVGNLYWIAQGNKVREFYELSDDETVVLYGEWCGGNIQGGVALANLERMFVIFSARAGTEDETRWLDTSGIKFSPAGWIDGPDPVEDNSVVKSIFDFENYTIDIDFNNPGAARNKMVEYTLAIEARCPVSYALGSDGIGEGVVWKPTHPDYQEGKFWFKVKGDKHSVTKVKTMAAVDVAKAASLEEFVGNVLTEARLKQGIEHLREMNLELSRSSTGDYLRWVFNDIKDEESDSLEASCLTIKDIGKPVSTMARKWFFKYLDSEEGVCW